MESVLDHRVKPRVDELFESLVDLTKVVDSQTSFVCFNDVVTLSVESVLPRRKAVFSISLTVRAGLP